MEQITFEFPQPVTNLGHLWELLLYFLVGKTSERDTVFAV